MSELWEYERIEHDNGRIVYEVHDPEIEGKLENITEDKCPDTTFIVFEGADARSHAAKFCAMMNRESITKTNRRQR